MPFSTELRLALRTLTRAPGFLLLALLTLTLGIGTTAALFSITESVLWRPLPFPDSERLSLLSEHNAKSRPSGSPVSAANFLDWRARARSFERLAAISYDSESHTLTGARRRSRVRGWRCLQTISGARNLVLIRRSLDRRSSSIASRTRS